MLTQTEQDKIWNHYQNRSKTVFDLSYPRLRYLAERCRPHTRVLTIGVGTGYLEQLLAGKQVELFALDPSEETVARLRRDLQLDESRARQGYSQKIPFPSDFFDTVIMTEVLEHLRTDVLHPTLDEVYRVLKPGGEFTGTVPYRDDLAENQVICPRCEAQFHRWGHEQSFDVASLNNLFVEHRYRVAWNYPRAFPDFRRRGLRLFLKAAVRYVLGRLGEPIVGPNLYFSARKPR